MSATVEPHDDTRPGPNATLPCPSESSRLRHQARGETCRTCRVGFEDLPDYPDRRDVA